MVDFDVSLDLADPQIAFKDLGQGQKVVPAFLNGQYYYTDFMHFGNNCETRYGGITSYVRTEF